MEINKLEIPITDGHVEPVPGLVKDHVRSSINISSVDDNLGSWIPGLGHLDSLPQHSLTATTRVAVGMEESNTDLRLGLGLLDCSCSGLDDDIEQGDDNETGGCDDNTETEGQVDIVIKTVKHIHLLKYHIILQYYSCLVSCKEDQK